MTAERAAVIERGRALALARFEVGSTLSPDERRTLALIGDSAAAGSGSSAWVIGFVRRAGSGYVVDHESMAGFPIFKRKIEAVEAWAVMIELWRHLEKLEIGAAGGLTFAALSIGARFAFVGEYGATYDWLWHVKTGARSYELQRYQDRSGGAELGAVDVAALVIRKAGDGQEHQPALPGEVGAVREVENASPALADPPFSLVAPSWAPKSSQGELF